MVSREEIMEGLRTSKCRLVFRKLDGSVRDMYCTLQPEYIAPTEHNRVNESVYKGSQNNSLAIPVWDLEKDAWRSFRVDRILDFNQEEITE